MVGSGRMGWPSSGCPGYLWGHAAGGPHGWEPGCKPWCSQQSDPHAIAIGDDLAFTQPSSVSNCIAKADAKADPKADAKAINLRRAS